MSYIYIQEETGRISSARFSKNIQIKSDYEKMINSIHEYTVDGLSVSIDGGMNTLLSFQTTIIASEYQGIDYCVIRDVFNSKIVVPLDIMKLLVGEMAVYGNGCWFEKIRRQELLENIKPSDYESEETVIRAIEEI